jgi:CRP-like cAMP-binding protein
MSEHFTGLVHMGNATPYIDRILDIIDHIRLFEDFERGEVESLAAYLRCYRAPAGVTLICEGDSGDFMMILLRGNCEIVKNDLSGVPRRIGLAGPGKMLGEMSMIDGEPRFSSCITLETTVFAVLDRDDLSRIIADTPRLGIKILMELVVLLSQRLRTATSKLVDGLGAGEEA